jgi:hypothetical protein
MDIRINSLRRHSQANGLCVAVLLVVVSLAKLTNGSAIATSADPKSQAAAPAADAHIRSGTPGRKQIRKQIRAH